MKCFITDSATYYDLPCKLFRKEFLPSETDYVVEGLLKHNVMGAYTLLPTSFKEVYYAKNLSGLRFRLKEKFRSYLKAHVKDEMCYAFLASLATGEIENKLLGMHFS